MKISGEVFTESGVRTTSYHFLLVNLGDFPTPRTRITPTVYFEDFENYLRPKRTRRGNLLVETTIQTKFRTIRTLSKRVNLCDSEAVESFIDQSDISNGRKQIVAQAYVDWCRAKVFEYEKKKYRRVYKLPYIPTEKDIDQLIAGFLNSKYGAYLQLLKETAFRPCEVCRLRPRAQDLSRFNLSRHDSANE